MMAAKIQNPNSVAEWMTELHRLAAMTGGSTRQQQESSSQALANCQRRCGEWLRANPDVKADFLRSQSWAQ